MNDDGSTARPDGIDNLDLARTREFVAALTKQSAALASIFRSLKKIPGSGEGDPYAMVAWLESAGSVTAHLPELERERNGLLAVWRSTASQVFLELEAGIRDTCQARSWRIDGQWPDLYVEQGVRIHVDVEQRAVRVGSVRLRSAAVTEVVKALEAQVPTLIPRDFTPSAFLDELAGAYDEVTYKGDGQVGILEVYRAFVVQSQSPRFWRDARPELLTAVTADQFRARLSKALSTGTTTVPDGRQLRLLPALRPEDAMFVWQPAENRFAYVGRIEFAMPLGVER